MQHNPSLTWQPSPLKRVHGPYTTLTSHSQATIYHMYALRPVFLQESHKNSLITAAHGLHGQENHCHWHLRRRRRRRTTTTTSSSSSILNPRPCSQPMHNLSNWADRMKYSQANIDTQTLRQNVMTDTITYRGTMSQLLVCAKSFTPRPGSVSIHI